MNIRLFSAGLALAGMYLTTGCGRESGDDNSPDGQVGGDVRVIPEGNTIAGLPGPVYESQAASRIHWQPWSKATFEMADKSRRLLLAVIALPQQPSYEEILNELSSDPTTVDLINGTYVPVLVDGDAVRELGLLTADLCAEIGSGLQLPLMVWMSPEGNPVAWVPMPGQGSGSAIELLAQSHTMVARTWADDPEYVSVNSRMDQANREQRLLARLENVQTSDEPGGDAVRALRQLTSLYDPLSRTFDEAGGLFPSGALDLLAMGARTEGLPAELRVRSRKVLVGLLEDLMGSAMFDPLDGGVFNSRRGLSWTFPGFHRDCASEARVIVSLLNAYEVTGDQLALDRAMGVLGHVEGNYRTKEGLFHFGSAARGDAGKWLWQYEDVREILSTEELAVWMPASGMKIAGNLPSEVDPLREHFRSNSIAFAKSADEVAVELGLDESRVEELLAGARKKLLDFRNKQLGEVAMGKPNAVATFRMVTAYATVYRITGEIKYRDLAAETLAIAKGHFSDGPRLRIYAGDEPDSLLAARAFVYGVAIQAALDVNAVTLDDEWLIWAGDLSSTVSEAFSHNGYIREYPASADLTGLPITDLVMLFDESTIGLLSMSKSRLDALNVPFTAALRAKVDILPMSALSSPILHTDLIQAALMREYGVTYVYGANAPAELRAALARSPLKGVNRREAKPADPAGLSPEPDGALRIAPGGKARPIKDAAEIKVPPLP